jgi:hypothetical protein
MRRLAVTAALGTVLAMLTGALTASPALAGRGPKWAPVTAQPFTLPALFCGFQIRVAFPVNTEYGKTLTAADGTTLVTGSLTAVYTNLSKLSEGLPAGSRAQDSPAASETAPTAGSAA